MSLQLQQGLTCSRCLRVAHSVAGSCSVSLRQQNCEQELLAGARRLCLEAVHHPGLLTGKAFCAAVPATSSFLFEGPDPYTFMSILPAISKLMPCAEQSWCCSAITEEGLFPGQPDILLVSLPKPQAALQGTAAKLHWQLPEGRLDKLNAAKCRFWPRGAADRGCCRSALCLRGSLRASRPDCSAP